MAHLSPDMYAFREYQTRSTILAERERAVDARRQAIQELRLAVSQLQSEIQRKRENVQAESASYAQKKAEEEARLQTTLIETEKEIETTTAALSSRQQLAPQVQSARERLQALKHALEDKDVKLLRLESRVSKEAELTQKRHALLDEKLARHQLGGWTDKVYLELLTPEGHGGSSIQSHHTYSSASERDAGHVVRLSRVDPEEEAAALEGRGTASSEAGAADIAGGESVLLVGEDSMSTTITTCTNKKTIPPTLLPSKLHCHSTVVCVSESHGTLFSSITLDRTIQPILYRLMIRFYIESFPTHPLALLASFCYVFSYASHLHLIFLRVPPEMGGEQVATSVYRYGLLLLLRIHVIVIVIFDIHFTLQHNNKHSLEILFAECEAGGTVLMKLPQAKTRPPTSFNNNRLGRREFEMTPHVAVQGARNLRRRSHVSPPLNTKGVLLMICDAAGRVHKSVSSSPPPFPLSSHSVDNLIHSSEVWGWDVPRPLSPHHPHHLLQEERSWLNGVSSAFGPPGSNNEMRMLKDEAGDG
eukprot:gene11300-7832_t